MLAKNQKFRGKKNQIKIKILAKKTKNAKKQKNAKKLKFQRKKISKRNKKVRKSSQK